MQREAALQRLNDEVVHLSRWIQKVFSLFETQNKTGWWKLGLKIRRLIALASLKSKKPRLAFDEALKIMESYQEWQGKRCETEEQYLQTASTLFSRKNQELAELRAELDTLKKGGVEKKN